MQQEKQRTYHAPRRGKLQSEIETPSARSLALCTDFCSLLFVCLLGALVLAFPERIPRSRPAIARLTAAGLLFAAGSRLLCRRPPSRSRSLLHLWLVLALFAFLFEIMASLQHLFFDGWLDARLVEAEVALTGTESTRWLEPLIRPPLTEWMMFAYVIYLPMLPLVGFSCYKSGGEKAVNAYCWLLALSYIVCYLGFLVAPVAGPLYWQPNAYAVPLRGGFFTRCAEWIRTHQHYPGGNFPSAHCAAGTVMLVTLARHSRVPFFLVGLPIVGSLYVATVYGRFHYIWDGVAGILVALLISCLGVRVVPSVQGFLARHRFLARILRGRQWTSTSSEG